VYLPLEFHPGTDAQADWGEGKALIAGERVNVQRFCMCLNYSRRLFMKAFPGQKQVVTGNIILRDLGRFVKIISCM